MWYNFNFVVVVDLTMMFTVNIIIIHENQHMS